MSTDTIKSPINLDNFEIVRTGNAIINAFSIGSTGYQGTGQSSPTITHNLGFTPVVFAFKSIVSGGYAPFPDQGYSVTTGVSGGFVLDWCTCFVDNSIVFFNRDAVGFNLAITIQSTNVKYFLCREKAATT